MNITDRLGYQTNDRLLIINADDFGMSEPVNKAAQQLLIEGAVSSATVMMPCPCAKEAVEWSTHHPNLNVGVHLTFTSEWDTYKWGPITRSRNAGSLTTTEGHFPKDVLSFELRADLMEVREEIVAQIESAFSLGLEPTHLDNHMGSLYGLATGKHFLPLVFEVCKQYGLPFRLPRNLSENLNVPPVMAAKVQQIAGLAEQMGVMILDNLVGLPFQQAPGETYESYKQQMIKLLQNLQPGVTELILHPSLPTDELKAIHPHWEKRGWEFQIFRDPDIRKLLAKENIRQIRWSELRDLQRGN